MAYTFQSRATADLIMLDATAKTILELLDKTPGEPGIITVEQIPQALATLEQAVAADEARRQELQQEMQSETAGDSAHAAAAFAELGSVTLRQRVAPFAGMLRQSAQEGKPVTWGSDRESEFCTA